MPKKKNKSKKVPKKKNKSKKVATIASKKSKKRKFRITVNEFKAEGGELVIGTVSVEFVKYWQERDSGDLIEHSRCQSRFLHRCYLLLF